MLVRVLGPADAAAFRSQRIRALREHPGAFGRTPEEVDSVEVWTERLRVDAGSDVDVLLGAFDADSLVGTVGTASTTPSSGTSPMSGGCMSSPTSAAKGSGAARALYASCGFRSIAIKPRVLKVGDHYHDEELMALALKPS